jgi:hypothetical protein
MSVAMAFGERVVCIVDRRRLIVDAVCKGKRLI